MTAKDLKNALLQEAVQGKLVPQIASEGNARDLLEEIRKEKAKLVKEGKIKKEKPLPEITEEEIPFDIPENWCWCRLSEICTKLVDGDHNPPAGLNDKTDYLMLSSRNINNDKLVDLELVRYLSKEIFEKENERTDAQKGDILFTSVGTLGRSCVFDGSLNICFQRSVSILNTLIYNFYLKYCLDSGYIQNYVISNATGTAQKGFYLNQLAELLIPLPPLAEQKRIVAALEKFIPLIEEYGKKETELKAFNEQIGTLTKKAILQEAVQGKLVPQIAAEGNAKDLLEEIKKEKAKLIKEGKIKKEKTLPEISDDEMPFDIPENWCWCRFSEIFQIINGDRGKNYPAKSTLSKQGIPFISALNLKNNTVEKDDQLLCVSESQYNKLGSGKLEKGDMVVCIRGSLGKHGIFPFEKGAIASSLVIVRQFNNSEILYKFLNIYLDSSLFNQEIKKYDNGTAQPNLAAESFKQFLFPLPPLAEQKRIVVAIEKMLSLCEKLGE